MQDTVQVRVLDPAREQAMLERALALADELAAEAAQRSPRSERRRRARLARVVDDPRAQDLVVRLADEVPRITDDRRAAARFAALVTSSGVPHGLGLLDRAALRVGAAVAPVLPAIVMPLVRTRLRAETDGIILSAEPGPLGRHLRARRAAGFRLNVNVLGEATLGEDEARRRLDDILTALDRPDVDYVSVKISAVCSRINPLAFDDTVGRVVERLRPLYELAHSAMPPKFVNLDMEEHHDLSLTVAAFRTLLDDDRLLDLDAGIALQAYLPDSIGALEELCRWAVERRARGGGRIKVRIVKGANLAMEQVEAELRGWPQAPYQTKADVDANYKRMLEVALAPEHGDAVRVGLASHNVFDLAWGMVLADELGAAERLDVEMLEGMAEGLALAVRDRWSRLVLYAPVVPRDQLDAAIAYLVRRFDENTAPDNYLRSLLGESSNTAAAARRGRQRELFTDAVRRRRTASDQPRRTQNRTMRLARTVDRFTNEPDTDFSLAANRAWIEHALASWSGPPPEPAAGLAEVEDAVRIARGAASLWGASTTADRRALLARVADAVAAARADLLVTMCHETGKTILEGDPEVSEAIDFARASADQTHLLDELAADGCTTEGGVAVVASPWNFPVSIPAGGVFAALAAGHAVILKPAPEAVACGRRLAQACWDGGVPRDLLQFLACADDDSGLRLVTHPDVDFVLLTGSYETASFFLDARPDLDLRAETSGKNAIVITAAADLDLAIADLVRSAFGHAGQKCSAASLAIVEASVLDRGVFTRRLADAVRSLRVGPAGVLATDVGPIIREPSPALRRALTRLDPGESWLVEPRQDDVDPLLWSPGVKLGVRAGSWSHTTEWFGPVLGILRAADLDDAIAVQNSTGYGLTGGIHSLDPDEIRRWEAAVEVGNAYVNRTITGAVVGRQPFGGWKRSSVGPSAKVGGPDHVLSLCRWRSSPTSARPLEETWRIWFASTHDPSGLRFERNELRYVPRPERVTIRAASDVDHDDLAYALEAAHAAGVTTEVVADDDTLRARLAAGEIEHLRALGPMPSDILRAAHAAGVEVDHRPAVRHPRVELLRWVRAQVVSATNHRHGRVLTGMMQT